MPRCRRQCRDASSMSKSSFNQYELPKGQRFSERIEFIGRGTKTDLTRLRDDLSSSDLSECDVF